MMLKIISGTPAWCADTREEGKTTQRENDQEAHPMPLSHAPPKVICRVAGVECARQGRVSSGIQQVPSAVPCAACWLLNIGCR